MKKILQITFLGMILFCKSSLFSQANTLDKVRLAVKNGNTSSLSEFLSSSIDLKIGKEEGVYSEKQSLVVLDKFFSQNPASDFKYNHVGSTQSNSKYYSIGTYSSVSSSYRVLISYKLMNGDYKIDKIHFDLE